MSDHEGMNEHSAAHVRDELEPLLPEFEVTSVPWNSERGEWIVTVWDADGLPLIDVFEVPAAVLGREYVLRRVGRKRRLVGTAATVADIPAVVRGALAL